MPDGAVPHLTTLAATLHVGAHAIDLSPQQTVIVRRLLHGPATRKDLVHLLWGLRSDGGALSAASRVNVLICHINRKLRDTPAWI